MKVEVQVIGFENFVKDTRNDLVKLEAYIVAKDWHQVRSILNTIHLDAKENRDYLYRVEGRNA
jgi:hypothetical protein